MIDESLERAKDRAWKETAAASAAYERGEIDDEGWHRAMDRATRARLFERSDAARWFGSHGYSGGLGMVAKPGDRSDPPKRHVPRRRLRKRPIDGKCAALVCCAEPRDRPFGLDIAPELVHNALAPDSRIGRTGSSSETRSIR